MAEDALSPPPTTEQEQVTAEHTDLPPAETKEIEPTKSTAKANNNPNPKQYIAQIQKLKQANAKYKELLKLAKERIQTQQDELDKASSEQQKREEELEQLRRQQRDNENSGATGSVEENNVNAGVIIRVCLRVKDDDNAIQHDAGAPIILEDSEMQQPSTVTEDIWVLLEYETATLSDELLMSGHQQPKYRRWKKWVQVHSEAELADFVRRDAATGEPLPLPPYSLSTEESNVIKMESQLAVSHVTEEFRRYRVRAEVARKQADAALKAAQVEQVAQTQLRIEKKNNASHVKDENIIISNLKEELKEQEKRWKLAYEMLEQENGSLKQRGSNTRGSSSLENGSSADVTLAGQWRHRYEECMKEKDELTAKLEHLTRKGAKYETPNKNETKYEGKYRALKDEYKLYRKKAKEIFDAQQRGENLSNPSSHGNGGTEEARIAYLRNLMVSYLSSEGDIKDHMEGAIGTVLKFTEDDRKKIKHSKDAASSFWYGYGLTSP
mmetsp:Transcript_26249/g.40688  ORF Transcript_26249/g.40688 Transcript_26249/m.40688 type:complete len:496 (-) Transcript_26249:27-1514(-)